MSTEVRKDSKRIRAFQQLEEAAKLLAEAGRKMTKAARALQLIEEAGEKVQRAARIAEPTTFTADETGTGRPKTLRDGLPADIRRAISREAERLQKLAARVKAVPITREQRVLAKTGHARDGRRAK